MRLNMQFFTLIVRHLAADISLIDLQSARRGTILSRRGSESRTRKLRLHYESFIWGNLNMAD